MIPSEKTAACTRPPRWLRKKDTVMGIIGNTHGVKMESSPTPNAVNRKVPRLPVSAGAGGAAGVSETTGFTSVYPAGTTKAAGAAAERSMASVKVAVFFGLFLHSLSLHT